nr:ATP-binding protein [Spirosoma arboris]
MPNGDLWFVTRNGLNFYDRQTGQFVRYELDPTLGEGTLHGRAINSFLVDKTGLVWVGSWSGGLSKQSRLLTFPLLTSDPQKPNSLQSPSVSAVYEAPSEPGIIWFATETGLDRFDKKTGIYTHYKYNRLNSHSIGEGKVVAMAEDRKGRFWVATGSNGLYQLNRKTGQFTQFAHNPAQPNSLMINYLNKLLAASDGTLWISTVVGLDHFDPDRQTFTHYYKTESTYTPALFDQINQLAIPKRQVAAIVRPGPNVDRTVNFSLTQPEDLFVVAGVDVFTFEKLSYGWIEDAAGKIVWEYSASNSVIDGAYPNVRLQANVIRLQAGQYRLRYHSGKEYAYGKWTHAPPTHPELWGVQLIQLNSPEVLTLNRLLKKRFSNGMSNASLFPLRADASGRIWIGSNSGGVVVFYPATGAFKSHYDFFEGPISTPTLLADKQTGGFWVGDLTRGLLLLDQQGKTTKRYSLTDGLPSNTVRSLQPDKEYLWIATDNGLCWLNPQTGQLRSFGLRNGLQSLAFTTDASCKTSDGELYFAGPKGVNVFYPGQLQFDSAVPPVVLTDLFINGQPATLGPDGQLPNHISITKEITLPHGQNDLTLQFAALSYNRGSESQYAFKLSPIDTAWVPIGATRQARFLDLQPGTYTFQVKAANADGVWNEKGTSVQITILPPWWRTWWAYLLYLLFFGALLRTYIVYRSRTLRWENRMLEEKVAQRTNEVQQQKEEIETQRDYLEETLTELKSTQDQLIQKEKLASLGELTAGIAHEIQNPLNFVNNFAEVSAELVEELKDELDRGDTQEAKAIANDLTQNLQKIHHHGGRASSIVKGMLEHSRTDSGEKQLTNLNALADEYLKIAYHGFKAKNKTGSSDRFNCELVTDFDPTLARIEVAPQEIGRVLLNLYNNAFYAVSERARQVNDPEYKPTVEVHTKRQSDRIVIQVRDNGTGIPESVKAKIFQPFFTTKPTGEGTGLGLSISYDIITKGHGGTLAMESAKEKGTEFTIKLLLKAL